MGESAKWYRVKPSYPKPAGGFRAILACSPTTD